MNEKIKIRGLATLSSWIFLFWGAMVSLKGLYDLFIGEPEANLYAPAAWEFVSREQWSRYGGFELLYGLACLSLAWYLKRYSAFLPETVSRPRLDAE
ncbi:MAG: hypothetical protein COB53_10210 [Elusimicrobia bacterium]|nr:MAG: hypothetical protein COB53_10210 [Elusimicrobiota bacterium]